MCLPVWREWKLPVNIAKTCIVSGSKCAFPFEGNGNGVNPSRSIRTIEPVWMSLPVWREWKQTSQPGWKTVSWSVWMSLPVWREWKQSKSSSRSNSVVSCVWMSLPVWREWKREEVVHSLHYRQSEWAFPFEGNGNPFGYHNWNHGSRVWMSLPVWRESKHDFYDGLACCVCIFVWMSLPVWRESKQLF